MRFNPWLRSYYERLVMSGKARKVALVAAMHKLLAAVWSVAKHRRPFVVESFYALIEGVLTMRSADKRVTERK